MSPFRVILRELAHHRWNAAAGLAAIVVAVGAIAGTGLALGRYEAETRQSLDAKDAEIATRLAALDADVRKAMGQLGFNLTILPQNQALADWYAHHEPRATMPAAYSERLVAANLPRVSHAVAQLHRRVVWPETKWTVFVVGRSAAAASAPMADRPVMVELAARHLEAPPPGSVFLGAELCQVLGFRAGDTIDFMGRKLRVARCAPREANRDDITVWMDLADAQTLLDAPGRISEIAARAVALGPRDLELVRREIAAVLPDTQVVEKTTETLAAATAALETSHRQRTLVVEERAAADSLARGRRKLTGLIDALIALAAALWVGWLAWNNAIERRAEIGVWRACGVDEPRLALLFAGRWVILGVAGAAIGLAAAVLFCGGAAAAPWAVAAAATVAVVLSALAGRLAALAATRTDAATNLRAG